MAVISKKGPASTLMLGDVSDPNTFEEVSIVGYLATQTEDYIDVEDLQKMFGQIKKEKGNATFPDEMREAISNAVSDSSANGGDLPADLLAGFETKWESLTETFNNSTAIRTAVKEEKKASSGKKKADADAKKAEAEAAEKAIEEEAAKFGANALDIATSNTGSMGVNTLDSNIITGLVDGVSVDVETGVVSLPKKMTMEQMVQTVQLAIHTEQTTDRVSAGAGWLVGDTINRLREDHGGTFEKIIVKSGMLDAFGVTFSHLKRKAIVSARFPNEVRAKCKGLTFTHFQEACIALPKTAVEAREMRDEIESRLVEISKGTLREKPDGTKVRVVQGAQAALRDYLKDLRAKYGLGAPSKKEANYVIFGYNAEEGSVEVRYCEELNVDQIASLTGKGLSVISKQNPAVVQVESGTEEIEWIDPATIVMTPSDVTEE